MEHSQRLRNLQSTDSDLATRKYQKFGGGAIWNFLRSRLAIFQKPHLTIIILLTAVTVIFLQEIHNHNMSQLVLNKNLGKGQNFGDFDIPQISDLPEMQKAMEEAIGVGDSADRPMWPRWMPTENDERWRQETFRARGVRDLIQFSGYRLGPKKLGAALLGATKLRGIRVLHGCEWRESDGQNKIEGSLYIAYEGPLETSAPYDLHYEAVALICNLTAPTGSNGGYAIASVDYESFVIYREESNMTHSIELPSEFKYDIVYCSNAYHDKIVARDVFEWMEFTRVVHKIDHFYIYDAGGVDENLRKTLKPYLDFNLVTITNIREVLLYSIKYWGQPLGNIDCVYRSRYTARWIMMADVDEYLHAVPPNTLQSLLSLHSSKAWLTHGSFIWDVKKCIDVDMDDNSSLSSDSEPIASRVREAGIGRERVMAVERFRVREREAWCVDRDTYPDANLCLAFWGHRKFFANPRLVDVPGCHELEAEGEGVNLNAETELRHHHVRGLGAKFHEGGLCGQRIPLNATETTPLHGTENANRTESFTLDEKYVFSDELREIAVFVKECPVGSAKDCYEKAVERAKNKNR